MLLKIIKQIFSYRSQDINSDERNASYDFAAHLSISGDVRSAINEYRKHLKKFPYDVEVLNSLGCCYLDIGENSAASEMFELAFSLDHNYRPALINYGRQLMYQYRSQEALNYLGRAITYAPDDPNVKNNYANLFLIKGNAEKCRKYSLQAWLGLFDHCRSADCFLFQGAYADIDESILASEHRFWAETLRPMENLGPSTLNPSNDNNNHNQFIKIPIKKEKIRIAYWSPDLRNHSVRYFALPLLENHDRNRFEIIVYHDIAEIDEYTRIIQSQCDHFIPVNEMLDFQLVEMMRLHDLDILVELAGHTSANRLYLLQLPLAKRQLTGLGYPVTTGLSTLHGKILDKYIVDDQSSSFYTEPPLVLDNSFWCFDPKDDGAIINSDPPVKRNGFITFACVGNIAKISMRMLECWSAILTRIPNSRLLIRSISLHDPLAASEIASRFEKSGIDMTRVDLFGPTSGSDLFLTYNDIDIILDTYPFNGGTTTCFATYMGVPVLSLAGRSLLSRMGKSILSNLGLHDWIVEDYDNYIDKAVSHAANSDFLFKFRSEARNLYKQTPLGNGKMFARDFENHCVNILNTNNLVYNNDVAALPAEELVHRAITVMGHGNFDAAQRIIEHCLKEYPKCGHAHVLSTRKLTATGDFLTAANYLESYFDQFSLPDKFLSLINIARFNIMAESMQGAKYAISRMNDCAGDYLRDSIYHNLFKSYADTTETIGKLSPSVFANCDPCKSFHFIITTDDINIFNDINSYLLEISTKYRKSKVEIFHCTTKEKSNVYVDHLLAESCDYLIILNENVRIQNEDIISEIVLGLEFIDILSFGGSRSWDRLDWHKGPSDSKAISFMIPSGEKSGFYELNFAGNETNLIIDGMSVLDGSFLAIKTAGFRSIDVSSMFDPYLNGAGTLQEQYFSHSARNANLVLGVHQNLGIIFDWGILANTEQINDSRWHLVEKMSFDPFKDDDECKLTYSIPLPSVEFGIKMMKNFFGRYRS